ncbi:hypothetical protein F4560_003219 [Saccharothrix ecbatanensis]|uniref:Recombinase zinc beta ribbon domain-containing protein n=1 Tax=Saccharothrix ecbatanensis TaxID=1105145 RepID=A0A7W9HK27_9PSEU|nr:zinc ribbon domain-containing protein [Saccharothrix ecbatanensis]MBB5803451.1 hypothetical protein [Saccharothrix ecbatanensis]
MSEHDFLTAQAVDTEHRDTEHGKHVYALSGRLRCGLCGRRLDSHRVHDRPAYRCRHGHTSTHTRSENTPRNLYLREDHLLTRIGQHLTAAGIATEPTPEQTIRLVRDLCRPAATHAPSPVHVRQRPIAQTRSRVSRS